jgi:DNA-binding IclR family transcriptional regulator
MLTSEDLIAAINNTEGYTASSYSGRGMMGIRCVAVSAHDSASRVVLAIREANPHVKGLAKALAGYNQDTLGIGIVVYFPNFDWPKQL